MIPNNVGAFTHLLSQIRKRVADGYRVLAHCFGGLGRAVLLGACLMLSLDQVRFLALYYGNSNGNQKSYRVSFTHFIIMLTNKDPFSGP
jgi:hypothetical protein